MELFVAGDFVPQNRVERLFHDNKFDVVLGQIKPYIENCDYSIVNLEAPIVTSPDAPSIKKAGPNLKTDISAIRALNYAGFKAVTLANNHFRDYGDNGVKDTLNALTEAGIDFVGGGLSQYEAEKLMIKEINGKSLAIINCCEHEYSIVSNKHGGSNPLSPIRQYSIIKKAKQEFDFVIVIVHGGHEMWQLPSPRMKEVYRYFVEIGADAVLNHHQHCFSGYEIYNGHPIFYGLGNFCFDRPGFYNGLWDQGYAVKLVLKDSISFELIPYSQCGLNPCVSLDIDKKAFAEKLEELNSIIRDDILLALRTNSYYESEVKMIQYNLEPYKTRILRKLFMKGLLPRFMTGSKFLKLENMVCCEAHRDKLLYYFNNENV